MGVDFRPRASSKRSKPILCARGHSMKNHAWCQECALEIKIFADQRREEEAQKARQDELLARGVTPRDMTITSADGQVQRFRLPRVNRRRR